MVVFDNLARILREIVAQSSNDADFKEWKLLGQEAKGQITVGWIEESTNIPTNTFTCIGIYQPKTNNFQVLCKFCKIIHIIQASVNSNRSLVSYVVKEKSEETNASEFYKHYITSVVRKDSKNKNTHTRANFQSLGIERQKQIMTNFLLHTTKDISKLLVFIHLESITIYQLKAESFEKIEIVKTDPVTKSFIWAQWDCHVQSLYFIHFRKTSFSIESEGEVTKQELSPTLSCLQFHENLPHETVLNIPLNLPSLPRSADGSCQIYEDDPLPLRIHDCSLDLVVVSDASGIICICHHYLYQPVKPIENQKDKSTVHFAYSVTLLHHGYIIHSVVPEVSWHLAKTMRPVFTLLGAQYLVVYAAGVFTHLLDIGLAHEPYCHILLTGSLSMIPENASRLVAIKGEFTESNHFENIGELLPTIMVDLLTMDLIEFEVTAEDLINCLITVESVSNRLSILHYFLVHASNYEFVEEALTILLKNPTDVNIPKFFQEILTGGAYSYAQKSFSSDSNSFLHLLPMTCADPSGPTETKVNQIFISTSQEILWNTAKMLLSPQQRLIPFNTDIWKKLWDHLAKSGENLRFKSSQVADKLMVSLGCYQPEALSCCSTPMSPGVGLVTSIVDFVNLNQAVTTSKKYSKIDLPFLEMECCTASKQEHVISVNLRELSLHLLKNCPPESPIHVHPVTTRYVAAQIQISKLLCHMLRKLAGIEDEMIKEKGFTLVQNLHPRQRLLLFTYFQRYYNAADTLAFPLPQGFSSFFCYLGFNSLSFEYFLMYLQNNVFELQIDVMKEIMKDIKDTKEGVNQKLRLLLFLPRSRAKRLLHTWPHGVSLMIRAREHALNILSGVQSSRPRSLPHSRRTAQGSKGLAAFPSADRLSPLDTFLDLLTAKASLTDLDFNLLIDATISSTQDILE